MEIKVGQEIVHDVFGKGIVREVIPEEDTGNGHGYYKIHFESDYNPNQLRMFRDDTLPPHLVKG